MFVAEMQGLAIERIRESFDYEKVAVKYIGWEIFRRRENWNKVHWLRDMKIRLCFKKNLLHICITIVENHSEYQTWDEKSS